MKKNRKEVQNAFRLTEPPDDELMALLADLGEGEVVTGVGPVAGDGYSAADIARELSDAIVADSVGELIARARKESGQSLRDVASMAGVSHGRVREMERSSNLEVATLTRMADAMGYEVKIILEPRRHGRPGARRIAADLHLPREAMQEPA
ncbi:MAG TPA: helix-turn-helix transcriptional regulator [Longimicrobium sp.]|jgi:hypothetical protein